jgi:cellulose binding protein with CBM10 domain
MKYCLHEYALVAAVAVLTACSASYDATPYGEGLDDGADGEDPVALGTSRQEFSYPTCRHPASDPDGDGWGWENNGSCVARKPIYGGAASGSAQGASCANPEGAASTMAAIAVSAAVELRRWQPSKDFAIGRLGYDEALVLTSAGRARCTDHVCANTQALLDFQKQEADGKVVFPGNTRLNAAALRSRLVAKFRDQLACEMQPSNGGTTNCPVEEHELTFQRSEKGGCDTNYFFIAKRSDGSPLSYPAQLKNKLVWADRGNPYIGFANVGEVVSIDPTYGLNEAGSTSAGSCSAACVRISKASLDNKCCTCNGSTRKYRKSAWSTSTFLCQ